MLLRVAKHVLGEDVGAPRGARLQRLHAAGHTSLPRLAQQPPRRAAGELEHLAALVEGVESEADRHVRAAAHELAEELHLHAGEVREAVYVDVARAAEGALRQAAQQLREPVRGVRVLGAYGGVEGAHDEGEIRQLLAQRAGRALRGLHGLFRREARGRELVHCGQELALQLRRAPRARVYAQPRVYGVERQRHAEQPSARVHRPPPARAELGLHLARKAGEGQHLGVQRQARSRDARKLALGLVAVLLRHQQAAPALVLRSGVAYFVHDLRGLARAGPACYESQHGSRPPHFRATL